MRLFKSIRSKLLHYTWDLAYGRYDESVIEDGICENNVNYIINPYRDKWFADPFIYEEDDDYLQLFVEEFDKNISRGRIARLKVDKSSNRIVECSIILDLPTHLSFPAIYWIDGKVYVHPENFSSGSSTIYEYDKEGDRLVCPIPLVSMPLTDAVIRKTEIGYEIYATVGEDASGCTLSKFMSDSFLGPYSLKELVRYSDNSARMAGYFFKKGDHLLRPAQDCNGDYGKAVLLYDDMTIVNKFTPWGKYDGLHTFNVRGSSFVIDLKKYDYQLVYRLKCRLKRR